MNFHLAFIESAECPISRKQVANCPFVCSQDLWLDSRDLTSLNYKLLVLHRTIMDHHGTPL